MRAALVPILVAAGACGASPEPRRVPEGSWGGDHVALVVQAAGARVTLDCAHGEATEALDVGKTGDFDVAGFLVQEHGGPAREDEAEEQRPARYVGTLDEPVIRFSIRLTEDGGVLGPFTATLGEPGRLTKCASHLQP